MSAQGPLLSVAGIEVMYSRLALVLRGLTLSVPRGGIVALLGANGAGKTTTMKAIANLLRSERGEVTKGAIHYDGARIDGLDPSDLARRGLSLVMEGRHAFPTLSVEDNLKVGAYSRSDGAVAESLERVYATFPRLKERRHQPAGLLSGGEQQMCVIGRALMARPRMILLDEPSMGLAPLLVEEIFSIMQQLNAEAGVTFLLAEQNAAVALRYATYGYLVEGGRVVREGPARALAADPEIRASYLGLDASAEADGASLAARRRPRWLS
ncbi:ABC transporter ATP-binding protein [Xanthobacter aminoxidans]|uniref:ABC transporter ATP-binding protein n=1 Tax=Xanthobacter aminoxidans TaxID=186280 RepID=A0ABW6ZB09_9HYPH